MVLACSAIAEAIVLAWAFMPLPRDQVGMHDAPAAQRQPQSAQREEVPPLDLHVFQARLWSPPLAPETAEPESALAEPPVDSKPLQLDLELIAITRDGENLSAAVYVPAADRLLLLAEGDALGGLVVLTVDERSLTLTDGIRTASIALPAYDSVSRPAARSGARR